jgi:hypothetical protein
LAPGVLDVEAKLDLIRQFFHRLLQVVLMETVQKLEASLGQDYKTFYDRNL